MSINTLIKIGLRSTLLALVVLSPTVWAGDADEMEDFERARQLVSEGAILPLNTILNQAEIMPGWLLLEVEFEKEHGEWIYELEILKEHGDVIKLKYDAATGKHLETELD
ncbi:MAG: hypothetical protein OQK78_09115 [Gammaproteobacteria bacterium]|nr:hypothetical protein [Gammaproteobacteria bacterium]